MRRTRTRQPRPPFPANNSTFAPQSNIWRTRRSSWGTRRGAPPRSRTGSAWFKTNFRFFNLFLRVFVLICLLWRGEVNVVLQGLGDALLGEDANVVGVVRQEAVDAKKQTINFKMVFLWGKCENVICFSMIHPSLHSWSYCVPLPKWHPITTLRVARPSLKTAKAFF